jgi:hypothetical protein
MNPATLSGNLPAPPPAPPAPPARPKSGWIDMRLVPPMFITLILVVAHLNYHIGESFYSPLLSWLPQGLPYPTLVAIVTALVMEMFLGKLVTGKIPHLASAYISGISVGILVRSRFLWPYVLCSMITITSKYVLRVRGRHLWNPSNFGVSVVFLLASTSAVSLSFQFDSTIYAMIVIWCLGALILYRFGRLHITLTYAAAFAILSLVRSALTGDNWLTEVAPLTGPMYQLFIFFMITDPKTTTRSKWSQCLVAVLVAVVETIFRLFEEVHAPYYALFIVGPVTNLIEIAWDAYKGPIKKPAPIPVKA